MNYVTATVFVKEANRVKAEQEADIEEETEVEEDTENNNEEKETTQDTPEKKGSTIDETTGEVVESKNYSKVIRAVKSKTGNYAFKANMVLKDNVKEFLKK